MFYADFKEKKCESHFLLIIDKIRQHMMLKCLLI